MKLQKSRKPTSLRQPTAVQQFSLAAPQTAITHLPFQNPNIPSHSWSTSPLHVPSPAPILADPPSPYSSILKSFTGNLMYPTSRLAFNVLYIHMLPFPPNALQIDNSRGFLLLQMGKLVKWHTPVELLSCVFTLLCLSHCKFYSKHWALSRLAEKRGMQSQMKSPNRWCKGSVSCRSFCMRFTVVYSGRSRLGLSPCAWFMWHTKRVCNSRISFVTLWRSVQIKGLISSSALAAHHGFSPNKAELRFQPTTAKSPRKDAPSFRTLKITEEADATPTHCPQFPSQLVMGDVHHE